MNLDTHHSLDSALGHLAESLRLSESGSARLEAARTHVALGKICHAHGDYAASREHFEKAATQFEVLGLADELSQTRQFIALPDEHAMNPKSVSRTMLSN